MSSDKTTGLVLRMADFSESSRVVVFLSKLSKDPEIAKTIKLYDPLSMMSKKVA